jgi:hypothetical protein
MTDVEKIKQYAHAMRRFRQFKGQDLCDLILWLEDVMTDEERVIAIEMSSDARGPSELMQ